MKSRTVSYIVGFVISIILTLIAFMLVENKILPTAALVVTIVALAVIQLFIQLVFFLHITSGIGARWKVTTFVFAVVVVGILVGGSIWIMNNLNYNMLQMSPAEQGIYMSHHEGL